MKNIKILSILLVLGVLFTVGTISVANGQIDKNTSANLINPETSIGLKIKPVAGKKIEYTYEVWELDQKGNLVELIFSTTIEELQAEVPLHKLDYEKTYGFRVKAIESTTGRAST